MPLVLFLRHPQRHRFNVTMHRNIQPQCSHLKLDVCVGGGGLRTARKTHSISTWGNLCGTFVPQKRSRSSWRRKSMNKWTSLYLTSISSSAADAPLVLQSSCFASISFHLSTKWTEIIGFGTPPSQRAATKGIPSSSSQLSSIFTLVVVDMQWDTCMHEYCVNRTVPLKLLRPPSHRYVIARVIWVTDNNKNRLYLWDPSWGWYPICFRCLRPHSHENTRRVCHTVNVHTVSEEPDLLLHSLTCSPWRRLGVWQQKWIKKTW